MPKKKPKSSLSEVIWRVAYIVLAVATLITLLVVSNFPSPYADHNTISLGAYALRSGLLFLPLIIILPLAASIIALSFSRFRHFTITFIVLTLISIIGYGSAISVFGDIGINDQPWLEDLASVLQPVFFFVVAPVAITAALVRRFGNVTSPNIKLTTRDIWWLSHVRNRLFPKISEIHYVILFTCTVIVVWQNPGPLIEEIQADFRVLIFVGMSIYLFIYILTPKKLGHDKKMWASMIYYGLLGALSSLALISQLEVGVAGEGIVREINLVLTGIMLAVSATRFLAALIIFRMDDGKSGKIMADRFSDHQHKILEFVIIILLASAIMAVLRQHYPANETLLLLTFAYSTAAYEIYRRLAPFVVRG